MGFVTIFVILFTICNSSALEVLEGEKVKLSLSFLCESTEVTLRLSNRVPFYSSADPNLSQDQNHQITNDNATESGKCFLHLTINSVSRDDMGTYILTTYKDGSMIDYTRIWLDVKYPPGWVSCESMDYYKEWVKLYCRAPVGSLRGQVECFQSGIRMPPFTTPEENGMILSQVILARSVGDPVYCCSSTRREEKEICECKDWAWDPVRDINRNIIDPCLETAVSSSGPTSSDGPIEHIAFLSSSSPSPVMQTFTSLPTLLNFNKSLLQYYGIGYFCLTMFFIWLGFVSIHVMLFLSSRRYNTMVYSLLRNLSLIPKEKMA